MTPCEMRLRSQYPSADPQHPRARPQRCTPTNDLSTAAATGPPFQIAGTVDNFVDVYQIFTDGMQATARKSGQQSASNRRQNFCMQQRRLRLGKFTLEHLAVEVIARVFNEPRVDPIVRLRRAFRALCLGSWSRRPGRAVTAEMDDNSARCAAGSKIIFHCGDSC